MDPQSASLGGPRGDVRLSARAVAVLTELASHPGEPRTRQQILEAAWPGETASAQDLEECVDELRAALGSDGDPYIEATDGDGYRVLAAVSWLDADDESAERFEIEEQIGGGGMGVVYRAVDRRLQRTVALKFLPPEWGRDPKAKERFLVEARAAAALDHPNICPVYEISETAEGRLFLVMPLYEGGSLAERLSAGQFGVRDALRIVVEAARGLGHAHRAGIVHRDIKPANLMLTSEGTVKILDFGLAKFAGGQALTATGTLMGTPAYMSPEQARGVELDGRTDIWSLGAVLYEMLESRRLFGGANHSVLHAILDRKTEILFGAHTPVEVRRVLARMLERDRDARYASCEELLRDLEAIPAAAATAEPLPETAVTAYLPSQVEPSPEPPARTPAWWRRPVVGLAAAVAIAVVAAIAWLGARGEPSATAPAGDSVSQTIPAGATPVSLTRSGRDRLKHHYAEAQLQAAISDFDNALALDPEHAPAYAGLAEAYQRLHDFNPDDVLLARARANAERAVELDGYLASARVSLGLVLIATGELAAAEEQLRRALDLDPLSARAHRELGLALWRGNKPIEARAAFETAVERDPDDWWAWTQLGALAFSQGSYSEAETAFGRTTEITPQNPLAFRNLAAAMQMQERYDEAAAALQASLEIQPSASIYSNLGTLLFVQGKYAAAVDAFERAVDLAPNDFLYWGNLGDAYRWAPGRRPEAQRAFERAAAMAVELLETDPTDHTTRGRLALFQAKAGARDEALATLEAVLSAGPLDANGWYRALLTYELAGERERALEALREVLSAGYPLSEIEKEPELIELRRDRRYHEAADATGRDPG